MWFESVTADAFGPFRGEPLSFAPGMNIVHGPNEAGKSTWHAALYAGLCGMRRGRGAPRREDRAFEERHRPWDGDGDWVVGAVVSLADGRRVELRHDLANGVDSSAKDADIAGRDYSNQIMHDGAPDGSVWLGLDRRSFLSTACVRQADLRGLLDQDHADELQEQLQRAAATAGTDATAAKALELLGCYQSEHVGSERAWTRPLQVSRASLPQAQRELETAQFARQQYLERRERAEDGEQALHALERRADVVRAVLAEAVAERAEIRVGRALELNGRFPEGPPRRPTEEDRLVRQVAGALHAWRSRPELYEPAGATLPELEQELEEIEREATETGLPEGAAAGRRSGMPGPWALLAGVGGAVAGGGLALVGLVVPGLLLFGLAIAPLVWWALARRVTARPLIDASAAREAHRRRIEQLKEARQREERAYVEAQRQQDEATSFLLEASNAARVQGDGPEDRVRSLREWERHRQQALEEADRQREQWDELQRLLGDGSLDELEAEASRLRHESDALSASSDAGELAEARAGGPTRDDLRELERRVSEARDAWNEARGELAQFARDLPSVVDAEEELAAAGQELERVERLDRTLRKTTDFLESAEERVHRDIALVLRETVLEWLPRVTNGRYSDCRVDPETLAVEVRGEGGRWRRAELLSHGTAEQLYLLLRVALARHLTQPGEVCPLILDEVVSACDAERKREVLEALRSISESVQVVLFSHEQEVLMWARERLTASRHRLIHLDGERVPA